MFVLQPGERGPAEAKRDTISKVAEELLSAKATREAGLNVTTGCVFAAQKAAMRRRRGVRRAF
jgi:hypothetical protein